MQETKRKRLTLSNAGCPKCKAIRPVEIVKAGRDIGAAEGWVETRCRRCGTVERIVPVTEKGA